MVGNILENLHLQILANEEVPLFFPVLYYLLTGEVPDETSELQKLQKKTLQPQ